MPDSRYTQKLRVDNMTLTGNDLSKKRQLEFLQQNARKNHQGTVDIDNWGIVISDVRISADPALRSPAKPGSSAGQAGQPSPGSHRHNIHNNHSSQASQRDCDTHSLDKYSEISARNFNLLQKNNVDHVVTTLKNTEITPYNLRSRNNRSASMDNTDNSTDDDNLATDDAHNPQGFSRPKSKRAKKSRGASQTTNQTNHHQNNKQTSSRDKKDNQKGNAQGQGQNQDPDQMDTSGDGPTGSTFNFDREETASGFSSNTNNPCSGEMVFMRKLPELVTDEKVYQYVHTHHRISPYIGHLDQDNYEMARNENAITPDIVDGNLAGAQMVTRQQLAYFNKSRLDMRYQPDSSASSASETEEEELDCQGTLGVIDIEELEKDAQDS